MEEILNSSPIPAKNMGAKNPIAMLFVVVSMAFRLSLPIRESLISIAAKNAPTMKCRPRFSVIVENKRTNAKNNANKGSLPFNNETSLSSDS